MYEEIRKEIFDTVLKLYQKDMIPLNSGNVSARAENSHFVITPRGIPYDNMTPDDLIVINHDGDIIEGKHQPSSEAPMHLAVYKHLPKTTAVVHTHSAHALAFAVVGRSIPIISLEGLDARGPVPVAEYACAGTEALGRAAVKALQGPPVVTGTLLKNHGVLTCGKTLFEAYATACRIEISARVYFLALQIGTPDVLTPDQIEEIMAVYSPVKK
ncbi:MAG: class II aldolase/adducin family protein [Smithella sp.]